MKMKKLLIVSVLFFLSGGLLQAQVIKPAVGMNFTDFSKDVNTGKFKSKVGYQVGASVAFGKKVYIEPGVYYVKKSTQFVDESTNADDIKYDLSGFYVPVSVGIGLLGDKSTLASLRAFGGASTFILTDSKNLTKADLNSASFGVFAGAGVDFSILFVEAKYEWSLSNIQKEVSQIDVGKSRSLYFNAGIRIPL